MATNTVAIEVLSPEDVLGIGLGSDILIVDDDDTNLAAFEAALAPLGRKAVLARSGTEALANLLEQDFALLLLDVSMPELDGLETARLIRQRPRNRSTPIIFITGAASTNETMLAAYEIGAYDFVIKPVLPEILRAKARVYLQLQERTALLQKLALRRTLTSAGRRLEKLQEATAALSEARTPDEVAAVAACLGAAAAEASAAAMWLAQPDGSLVVAGSHNIPAHYLDTWRVIAPDSALPPARVIQQRRPMWVESAADFEREVPEAYAQARAANRVVAFTVFPLVSSGKPMAALSFSFPLGHTFTDEERTFLVALARTCEQALERARLYVAEADARRAAEALNERKDELLAMLGHELRNPLAAIVSAIDIIKLRDPGYGRELAVLDRQVTHLTHLVGDLVDVARITQGRIVLRREPVAVVDVLRDAIDAVRPAIDAHQVSVDVGTDVVVDADRHRLTQVLTNLLSNAAKYTPSPGRIEITADVDDELARIAVRDNGRGVAAELLPNLFELFVQGERAPDRREGGLGIGLTLVRKLVELHGGSIEARSDGPGTGATFAVRWPRASSVTATAKLPAVARPVAAAPLRILIVDDNVDAAEMMAAVVGSLGHDVALANDGETGLELARQFAPHIALLDIGLPMIDGYELATRLRSVPACASTVLIAVTGYGQPEDRERSKRAGFKHHLVKPVELSTLREVLVVDPDDW